MATGKSCSRWFAAVAAILMVVALSYSSRWEIMNAMKKTVKEAMENGASYEEVEKMLTEETLVK